MYDTYINGTKMLYLDGFLFLILLQPKRFLFSILEYNNTILKNLARLVIQTEFRNTHIISHDRSSHRYGLNPIDII